MSDLKIRTGVSRVIPTRDGGPLRVNLSRIAPAFRSGVEQALDQVNALILASAKANGVRTHDDLLTGPEPTQRIGLGKVWTGGAGDPLVSAANTATEAFASGCFAASRPLRAEALKQAIDMGRRWVGDLEVVLAKARAAEEMPAADNDASDIPVDCKGTRDAQSRLSPHFNPKRGADYAAALRKGREAQTAAAPERVRTAADYAANLKAGRAAKGAA